MFLANIDMMRSILRHSSAAMCAEQLTDTQAVRVSDNFSHSFSTPTNYANGRDNRIFHFQARSNMTMLQSEDLMKAAMASLTKSEEPPEFSKL